MALDQLSLGIPGDGPTNFAATPIPMVPLFRSAPEGPLVSRSELGYAELLGRSNRGVAQISGPAYKPTYAWAVATMLTLDEALQLGALAKWQDAAYKAKTDGALRLIDETELLDPEPNPHSRTLLEALTPAWASTYRYGYGVFEVKLQLPEDWRIQAGLWARGELARLCTFSLVEI